MCTTCINGSQTNRHINNCFICNTDEGKLLVCQQCVRLSHKPCIDKLRIPVTDDTFLCPWCMPATPLEQQPTHRHTDSDDGEGNDQHDEPIQKDTAATEPPQQQQQTSDTQTTETQKRDTKKPTKTNQTTSHKCKTARRGTLKCTYCKKTIGNQLAHNCTVKHRSVRTKSTAHAKKSGSRKPKRTRHTTTYARDAPRHPPQKQPKNTNSDKFPRHWYPQTPPTPHVCVVCQQPSPKEGNNTVKCRKCKNRSHKPCLQPKYPSITNAREYTCRPCARSFKEKLKADKLARGQIAGAQPIQHRPSTSKKATFPQETGSPD